MATNDHAGGASYTRPFAMQEVQDALEHLSRNLRTWMLPEAADTLDTLLRHLDKAYRKERKDLLKGAWHPMGGILLVANDAIASLQNSPLSMAQREQLSVLIWALDTFKRHALDLQKQMHGLSLEQETLDLVALVHEFVNWRRLPLRQHGGTLLLASHPPYAYVHADRHRLVRDVLNELVDNAWQHRRPDTPCVIELTLTLDHGFVQVHVRDNGSGIRPEHLPHIFESSFFYQEDHQQEKKLNLRRGQGLAIARKVIEAHNGSIRAESEPNKYTCFTIALQRAPAPTTSEPATSSIGTAVQHLTSITSGQRYLIGPPTQLGSSSALEAYTESGAAVWIKQARVEEQAALTRLFTEAALLERLRHTHLVQILDRWKTLDTSPQAQCYVVLRKPPGKSLQKVIEVEPLPLSRVLTTALHLARLLHYLHHNNVLCRTLSPSAIYSDEAHTILVDLSASCTIQRPTDERQHAHVGIGDGRYYAPEDLHAEPLDQRSDMYVYGVLLFELLIGHPPFWGHDPAQVAIDQASPRPAPDIQDLRPDMPDDLAAFIMRCLHKLPGRRYPDTATFLQTIQAIAATREVGKERYGAYA
ncbi:MAG: protein kinase [Chloroflexaceae bacterium]|nr:protein kinase [Chloroflexaceae bacterium]